MHIKPLRDRFAGACVTASPIVVFVASPNCASRRTEFAGFAAVASHRAGRAVVSRRDLAGSLAVLPPERQIGISAWIAHQWHVGSDLARCDIPAHRPAFKCSRFRGNSGWGSWSNSAPPITIFRMQPWLGWHWYVETGVPKMLSILRAFGLLILAVIHAIRAWATASNHKRTVMDSRLLSILRAIPILRGPLASGGGGAFRHTKHRQIGSDAHSRFCVHFLTVRGRLPASRVVAGICPRTSPRGGCASLGGGLSGVRARRPALPCDEFLLAPPGCPKRGSRFFRRRAVRPAAADVRVDAPTCHRAYMCIYTHAHQQAPLPIHLDIYL